MIYPVDSAIQHLNNHGQVVRVINQADITWWKCACALVKSYCGQQEEPTILIFGLLLCTYQRPSGGGGGGPPRAPPPPPRPLGHPGHLHNVYKSPYPKPTLLNKLLLTPLQWGQRSVLFRVKRCNISKEFYRRTRSFLPKNIVAM